MPQLIATFVLAVAACMQAPWALAADPRVADLLARMTHEEKLAELRIAPLAPGARASRLGIPVLFYADDTPGGFPKALALAASWDVALAKDVATAIGEIQSTRGAHLWIGPILDISRDPRRGQVARTFGEDPHLAAEIGVAMVQGLQGPPGPLARGKVLAAIGYFAGPPPPTPESGAGPAPVSERELRDTYLSPFEEVLRRSAPAAVLVSRNEIDGVPSHASKWLLRDVLRNEWKFDGLALGAPEGIGDLHALYQVAAGAEQAASLALGAGLDASLGDSMELADGERLDAAVARVLAFKVRAGLFDRKSPAGNSNDAATWRALALTAARRSITLLKNDGTLPLAKEGAKVAIIKAGVVPAAIVNSIGSKTQVVADARNANRVVLLLGDGGDAAPALARLKALGKPIVAVIVGDRPVVDRDVSETAQALVAAWGLGERAGEAIADVLVGDANPGGKLPLTIARSPGQMPLFYNAKPSARRGYLFESSEPLYPFGHGLSYSTFELGAPRLSSAVIGPDGTVTVSVDVAHRSGPAGHEVVQLYVRDKVSSVTRPVKELKGFARVSLKPGEQRTVELRLAARSLSLWDEGMRRVVEPGEFEIMTGPSSAKLQSVTLTVREGP